jgi:predicted RNase H-like HicB family nuclease
MQHIEITVCLKSAYREDSVATGFVSYCPSLKIYAHGKNAEEAMTAMEETLKMYVGTCFQRGILNQVLNRAGFSMVPDEVHNAMTIADAQAEYILIKSLGFEDTWDVKVQLPYSPEPTRANPASLSTVTGMA